MKQLVLIDAKKEAEGIREIQIEDTVNIQQTGINPHVRTYGQFKGTGFFLQGKYDWVIGKDDNGEVVLVPLVRR